MHATARQYVVDVTEALALSGRVLEFGSRYINGGVRDVIPHDHWCGVDICDGADVDVVDNAAEVEVEPGTWDVVVSTELLEHTPEGEAIVANAHRHLKPGGWFVATMAGPGRAVHSASGSSCLAEGEWYLNVEPEELRRWLNDAGFESCAVETMQDDVRCVARKGG
jgi:predicted SAM-dependent methyltransferase